MNEYWTSAIDHLNIAVSDIDRSRTFYTAAFAAIGVEELLYVGPEHGTESGGRMVGYGKGEKPFFWILDNRQVGGGTHVAFSVPSRELVDAFHAAALSAGGTDNGGPGLRTRYHPNYYGAFVLDPDGINVEAVCHDPA